MAAPSITHAFVSAKADGGDATLVRPSNWNAAHTLTPPAGSANLFLQANAGETAYTHASLVDAGTRMLFYQATAPTGWTRVVDAVNSDAAIIARLNNEVPGTGGSWAVSGLTFAGNLMGTHTHTFTGNALPTHQHTLPIHALSAGLQQRMANSPFGTGSVVSFTHRTDNLNVQAINDVGDLSEAKSAGTPTGTTDATSAGTPSGSISSNSNWRPKYIDVIVASRN